MATCRKLSGEGIHTAECRGLQLLGKSPRRLMPRPVCSTTSRSPRVASGTAVTAICTSLRRRPRARADRLLDPQCGTISPPIFEKRLMRPVIVMKSVGVDHGHVARHVPAVAHHLGREFGPVEIALHHVRAADQQHALPAAGRSSPDVGIDDLHLDARQRAGRPFRCDCRVLAGRRRGWAGC